MLTQVQRIYIQELTRLNNLVAIISTGRQAYINQLGTELNKKEDEFED